MPLTRELLARGRERYGIFCSPCHGLTGNGLGIVVQRGLRQPPNFDIDRLRAAPVGYFFDVQSNGFGAMMDYAAQIPPADRWAIAAYLRALQLSQRTTLADVPAEARGALESPDAPAKAAPLPIDADDWKKALGSRRTFEPRRREALSMDAKNDPRLPESRPRRERALTVGVLALAVSAVGAFANPTQFYRSYLLGLRLLERPGGRARSPSSCSST